AHPGNRSGRPFERKSGRTQTFHVPSVRIRVFPFRFFRCERLALRLVIRKEKNRSQIAQGGGAETPEFEAAFLGSTGAAPFLTGLSIHGGTNTQGFRLSPNGNPSNVASVGARRRRGTGYAFRRHPANHQARPERTERGQGVSAGARRRDDRLGRR